MKKILLIEDNDELRSNTSEILSLSSYHVIEAHDGKVGVQMALDQKPDLILCDIMMPELDGYGVLHAVHKSEVLRNTPFIFLTSKSERTDYRRGMEMGVDDYITKPFTGTELLQAIDVRINKHDLFRSSVQAELSEIQFAGNAAIDRPSLKSITEEANIYSYRKKEIVYSEGKHAHGIYYVISGSVKAYKTSDSGKDLIVDLYKKGDYFGYVALLENGIYKDSTTAIEDTELAFILKKDFEPLIFDEHNETRKIFNLLVNNITEKGEHLLRLAYSSLRKKVADALIYVGSKSEVDHNGRYMVSINRESLAAIAGVATESFIRTLSEFRSENSIELKDGKIIITDLQKLSRLLN